MRGAIDKSGRAAALLTAGSVRFKSASKPARPWWQFWG
jgi:hypothetical protein